MYRDTEDARQELAATNRMNEVMASGPERRAAKRAELAARLERMAQR